MAADIPAGIVLVTIGSNFKVNMGTGRTSRITHRTDDIALINDLARENIDAAKMAVKGFIPVAVINYDQITIAIDIPASKGDCSGISGEYTRSFGKRDIHPRVAIPIFLGEVS